jgi:PhnB protein
MPSAVAAHLVVKDPERAATWYATVIGGTETDWIPLPDGSVFAIDLAIGDTTIALAGEYPDMGIISPKTLGGTYLALIVATENADEVWVRAIEGGASEFHAIAETFYGERAGQFIDPFGHRWGAASTYATCRETNGTRLSPRCSHPTDARDRCRRRDGRPPGCRGEEWGVCTLSLGARGDQPHAQVLRLVNHAATLIDLI